MWTMYNREGKEDDEYRLLHVYYSIKRANNIASILAKPKVSSNLSKVKRNNHLQRKRMTVGIGKGTKKQKRTISKPDHRSVPTRALPSPSPCAMKDQIFRQSHSNISPNTTSTSSGCILRDLSKQGSFEVTFEGHKIHPVPSSLFNNEYSTFPSNKVLPYYPSESSFPRSGSYQNPQLQSPPDLAREFDRMLGVPLADPSSMIKEPNTEWSALMGATSTKDASFCDLQATNERYPEVLMQRLRALHKNIIHELVDSRPRSERGRLVSVVANWARSISQSPLEILIPSDGNKEQRDFGIQNNGKNASLKLDDWDMAVEV